MELISKGVASYVLHLLLADLDEDDEADAHKMDGIFSAIEAINNAPVINQWVSVDAAEPEEDGRYLATVRRLAPEELGGNRTMVRIMRRIDGDWKYGHHFPEWINDEIKETVTHWMRLPEPMEGDRNGMD